MNKIDRRTFLKYSAGALAVSSLNSCANTTGRYLKPEQITKKNEKFLIKNAKIIDVRYGRILPQKNILISNGKIIKLLHNWELKKITFDRGINLNGAYAMPGLINSHCHITMPGGFGFNLPFFFSMKRQGERNAEECIKHGVTTVRDLGSPLRLMDSLKNKINKNELYTDKGRYTVELLPDMKKVILQDNRKANVIINRLFRRKNDYDQNYFQPVDIDSSYYQIWQVTGDSISTEH